MQEVSKAAPYHAVLSALAHGASQYNEIATQAGVDNSAAGYYLKELSRLGIVKRVEPVVGGGRKAIWRITDNLFRFWYRFVRPRQPLVERGYGTSVAERIVTLLPDYLGPVFEDVCRDWLWRQLAAGALPFAFTDVGGWWGNDPAARSQAEIDIVAVDDNQVVLLGECKWRNEQTGADQLEKLARRAHLAGGTPTTPLWLFSRAEFTSGCKEAASAAAQVRLIRFAEMAGQAPEGA